MHNVTDCESLIMKDDFLGDKYIYIREICHSGVRLRPSNITDFKKPSISVTPGQG
jgi:hypothetical protein